MKKDAEFGNKPIISFDDRPKDFIEGVEFGIILEKLQRGDEIVNNNGFPIRLANQELIYRACEYYNYTSFFKECNTSGWVEFQAKTN